jgi:phosphate transport system permease protein
VPLVRSLEIALGVAPYGVGILTASVVLSIMIVPYSISLISQVIALVPSNLKEAAYSLGATRFEVIMNVIIPYTRSGISAGILLSLGRALGETMAVTMLIGNAAIIPDSIFSPANTMASVIANEFTEATGEVYLSALVEMGLFLFVVTTIINVIGRRIIKRFSIK